MWFFPQNYPNIFHNSDLLTNKQFTLTTKNPEENWIDKIDCVVPRWSVSFIRAYKYSIVSSWEGNRLWYTPGGPTIRILTGRSFESITRLCYPKSVVSHFRDFTSFFFSSTSWCIFCTLLSINFLNYRTMLK